MKAKKLLKTMVLAIVAIILILLISVGIIWRNEIGTILSIKQIASYDEAHRDGNVYTISYKGGYYFDEFLKQGGASSDKELMSFIMNHITKGIAIPGVTTAGCTSFTCETENGDRLFCRNFDLSKSNTAVIFTEPGEGRYSSISLADLKYAGVGQNKTELGIIDKVKCLALPYALMDGMNEKGLAVSIYICSQGVYEDESGSHTTKTNISSDKPDITSTTMMRMVLDYAATVDEAIEMIQQYDLHDSSNNAFHYAISDATGKAACLEWINGTNKTDLDGTNRTLCITYSDGATPLVLTNYVIANNYYSDDSEKKGIERYQDVTAALNATDNIVSNEAEAMEILNVAGVRTRVIEGKQAESAALTLWSAVYNLSKRTVTIVFNEHYGESDYTFTFEIES